MSYLQTLDDLFDGASLLADAFLTGLRPDPQMTVTEWAEKNRILPEETTKEHGAYRIDRIPFMKEIQDNLSATSPVVRTVLMKGAQLSGSETGLNMVGYIIDVAQGPCIIVCPTVEMAERHSETRIKPMVRLCKSLKKKMGDPDAKTSGNRMLLKRFPGGLIVMTGANSGASLRSLPARFRIFEEVDAFPDDVDGEGCAVDIVAARGFTFGVRGKDFLNCTPRLRSTSIIFREYMKGDQREYMMPCPAPTCGQPMAFNAENFGMDGDDPETAHMVCPTCQGRVVEATHKTAMMAAGVWVPKVKKAPRRMPRSYYLPSFYSPWLTWLEIAEVKLAARTNLSKAKTYFNTYLGLPWTDAAATPGYDEILEVARACVLRARQLPDWAVHLFAGVDVGIDHIEIGIWAYGSGGRRHLVEQVRLAGAYNSPEQWARLSQVLKRGFLHPLGAVLRLSHVFIDRGKWTTVVDAWVQAQDPRFVSGIKGHKMDAMITPRVKPVIGHDGKPIPNSVAAKYFLLNSGLLKLELYGQINQPKARTTVEAPEPVVTYHNEISQDYAEQLVSEDYVTTYNRAGFAVSNWIKREQAARGEALDTACYARGASIWKGVDQWLDTDWRKEREKIVEAARKMEIRIEAETKKRLRSSDRRPVTILDLVKDVAVPIDASVLEDEIEEAAASAEDLATAPTPVQVEPSFATSWGGWAPREHTVVREAEEGVVGADAGPSVWEPEFGSMYD